MKVEHLETQVRSETLGSGRPHDCDECGYEFVGNDTVFRLTIVEWQENKGSLSSAEGWFSYLDTIGYYCKDCIDGKKDSEEVEERMREELKKQVRDAI